MRVSVRVGEEDFDIAEQWAAMRKRCGGEAGALVAFGGLVRDYADGSQVSGLTLEHHPDMTAASMRDICRQAGERWRLLDVVVEHRIGELSPEDQIVLVLVASAHRADAFAAGEFIMDYLKTDAVLWKKERRDAGDVWLEATAEDQQRRESWRQEEASGR